MRLSLQVGFLIPLVSALSFAESWSGLLVDSDCYQGALRNTSHGAHPGSIDTRKILDMCAPSAASKSFEVVRTDGMSLKLDSNGSEKARELIMKAGKMSRYRVNVTGAATQDTLNLDSISISK